MDRDPLYTLQIVKKKASLPTLIFLVMKPQPDPDHRHELCPSSVSEWSVERKSRLRK